MKSVRKAALLFAGMLIIISACGDLFDGGSLGGDQSSQGEEGNSFDVISAPEGVSGMSAIVTSLNDGISTISYTATINNSSYLEMASSIPGASVNGNVVTVDEKYRITTEGMESIFDEGSIILVKYDASVGDRYELKRGSSKLIREVTYKSTEDDYFWNWMYIKTIRVKETGRNIPGVSNIEYVFNHKFGIVGLEIQFEDGSTYSSGIYSQN